MSKVLSDDGVLVDLEDSKRLTDWHESARLPDGSSLQVERMLAFVPEYDRSDYAVKGDSWKYVALKDDARSDPNRGIFVLTASVGSHHGALRILSRTDALAALSAHPPRWGAEAVMGEYFPARRFGTHPSDEDEKAMKKAAEDAEELERLRKRVEELEGAR